MTDDTGFRGSPRWTVLDDMSYTRNYRWEARLTVRPLGDGYWDIGVEEWNQLWKLPAFELRGASLERAQYTAECYADLKIGPGDGARDQDLSHYLLKFRDGRAEQWWAPGYTASPAAFSLHFARPHDEVIPWSPDNLDTVEEDGTPIFPV